MDYTRVRTPAGIKFTEPRGSLVVNIDSLPPGWWYCPPYVGLDENWELPLSGATSPVVGQERVS